ncbi:DegT/DnrJ/EryC1/StrS family aminotransferase [uncultured Desulfuromusa sp.]|uniref:DegT/DnrJ/EryC1/StrS family aminotransferase n=1 Tax=uncultured Desulfuromusa sp. TaxID=219183 RepID=UPI002AA7C7A7|nr:DegT/DnrJ/EryC1/StrS family aminotransferase [uncultured Desulfuromusa sp.]
MEFIDLAAQQARIKDKIDAAIQRVLAHGKYIMGPEVLELEERLADYVGVKHCISCASGTDALLMSLMAYGVGPGDAIFTTPFTFVATGEVISLLGATPIFVDIDPKTFNIDPIRLEEAMSDFDQPLVPKGIIPVDLFGLPADYEGLTTIARKHGLFVLEDAAQSFGATYKGRKACSLADAAATSFFPAKPLGCYGDGGAIFTDDDELAEKLQSIRVHGKGSDKYDNVRIGINGRLDTIQAAILLTKLAIFPDEVLARQKVVDIYSHSLSDIREITTPYVPKDYSSVWAQYSILLENKEQREYLQAALQQKGIPTAVYYPKPLHLQTAYVEFGFKKGDNAHSEGVAERILSLPMGPYLKKKDQDAVVAAIRNTFGCRCHA